MVGFGERLKKARNDNHLTQVQLAKRLSIDRVTLTNYESDGKRQIHSVLTI